MFKKYKYLVTMFAMVCLNLSAFYYLTNPLLAMTYLSLGLILLFAKAIVLKRKGENLLDQYVQWLAELSMLSGVVGWGIINQKMLVGLLMLVTAVVGSIAFIFIAMCREMSKNI